MGRYLITLLLLACAFGLHAQESIAPAPPADAALGATPAQAAAPAVDPSAVPSPAAAAPTDAPTAVQKPAAKATKGKKPPAAATTHPAASPSSSASAQPDHSIEQSQLYRRDLVNLLALRTDAPLLLAAAVLALPDDGDSDRPHALRAGTLLERAQAAGPKDALVWWITAFTCGNALQICPRPDALLKLEAIDANNAAVWILEAARAQQAGDVAAADAALKRAAAAHDYNDYSTELTRTLLAAISNLPVPGELVQSPPPGVAATAEGVRLTVAFNLAARLGPGARPAVAATLDLCDPAGAHFAARRADCSTLAAKLDWSSSLLSQRAGVALRQKLKGKPDAADAEGRQRNLAWQQQRSGEVMQGLLADAEGTRALQRIALQSHTESGLVYALLREANIPLEAPLDPVAPSDPAAAAVPPG